MVERPPCPATSASACGRFKLEDLPYVPKNCRIKKTLTKPIYRRIRMLKRWLMSCPPVDFFLLAGGRLWPAMSAFGTKRTFGEYPSMSAFGCKADIGWK